MCNAIIKKTAFFMIADILAIAIFMSFFFLNADLLLNDIEKVTTANEELEQKISLLQFDENDPDSLFELATALEDTSELQSAIKGVLFKLFWFLSVGAIAFAFFCSLVYFSKHKKHWWKIFASFLGLNLLLVFSLYLLFLGLSTAVARGISGAIIGALLVLFYIAFLFFLFGLYPFIPDIIGGKKSYLKVLRLHSMMTPLWILLSIISIFVLRFGVNLVTTNQSVFGIIVFVISIAVALILFVLAPSLEKAILFR
jgi:hypothetical protein